MQFFLQKISSILYQLSIASFRRRFLGSACLRCVRNMNNLLLKCSQSASQVLLLTAAVRDIQHSLPGMFRINVQTSFPEIWENNPYLDSIDEGEIDICIECGNDRFLEKSERPLHSLRRYGKEIGEKLKIRIQSAGFSPDIHLSALEKESPLLKGVKLPTRFWILNAGSSSKRTVRQWSPSRYQQLIDHYRNKIQFIQIGRATDCHPQLNNVIDLRGKTTIRELISLIYHSEGVVTSPGLLMHLAAAIENNGDRLCPCLVIAGGREPVHWNIYSGQYYLNTIGLLQCCYRDGCWRSRTSPLGDGRTEDDAAELCINPTNGTPRCLEMIDLTEVIQHIDKLRHRISLKLPQTAVVDCVPSVQFKTVKETEKLSSSTALREQDNFIRRMGPYPSVFSGQGIVICAGGAKLIANAWVCINMLRWLGCQLPIQIWHLGPDELDEQMRLIMTPLNVEFIDAYKIRQQNPARRLAGWELKSYSILHCSFKQVILLDADNVPVVNPEFLFNTQQFNDFGAIFWPDIGHLKPSASIWRLCGVPYRDEAEWETGQIVIDKEKCWRPLLLTTWYNDNSDFYYQHILGDKETFHMAFRRLSHPVAVSPYSVRILPGVLCQHDFTGRLIFQHRTRKWKLLEANERVAGFLFEMECLNFLRRFREKWDTQDKLVARIDLDARTPKEHDYIQEISSQAYKYIRVGYDQRVMTFSEKGTIEQGSGGCEKYWDLRDEAGVIALEISDDNTVICRLTEQGNGDWRGRWLHYEKMPVELIRIKPTCLIPVDNLSQCPPTIERKRVLFRAAINNYTGYGLHAAEIVRGLTQFGYDVFIRATHLNEQHATIPTEVRKLIACQDICDKWELMLLPPGGFEPRSGTHSLVFTMWEATRISPETVRKLNEAYHIIVPCHWNASCFSACGVDRPIDVVPLGINSNIFNYAPMVLDKHCIFGAAGRMESGGMRKGIEKVILAFQKAFPDSQDVRLRIKIFPDDELPVFDDERIEVIGCYLSEIELAKWFSELTCFVSCSHGEAWGLMLHQALAVGRPVISALHGGVTEFFTEEFGYPVRFQLAPAQGFYEGYGAWAEVELEDVIEQMRSVFHDRMGAREKGLKGSQYVSRLTWNNSNIKLLNIMKDIGMVT